ncbi:MAG: hypothetical protein UHK60_07915 [Acutalibacteraceae bacterium]|nr:hypothetical protein [Acutalibacteraceae bacterium]
MKDKMLSNVDFETMLKSSVEMPLVKIDRAEFLKSELQKYYSDDIVQDAIDNNPAHAGIPLEKINKIANASINVETMKLTSLSFSGGTSEIVTEENTNVEASQYFAHVLRIIQKLVYLYGWQDIFDENGCVDDETTKLLTVFTGVMCGVNEANSAITKISNSLSEKATEHSARKALTKGKIYSFVENAIPVLGFSITKKLFAKGVSKTIPIVGGIVSSGITFATYKPMALKLKKHLAGLKFADVDYYKSLNNEKTEIIAFDEHSEVMRIEEFISDENFEISSIDEFVGNDTFEIANSIDSVDDRCFEIIASDEISLKENKC